MNVKVFSLVSVFFVFSFSSSISAKSNGEMIFKQKCSLCHSIEKKKLGPAVKLMSKEVGVLRDIISKGKKPMPAYEDKLTSSEIDSLVEYLLANQ